MILYIANDALMCKIFTTTLQGKVQDSFHTMPPQSIWSFDELSVVFTKECSSYCSIKKKYNNLFNIKKNLNESLRDYLKRFKAKKVKIVDCNDSIASAAFQKGLPTDYPLFKELIMKEDLTLADSFVIAKKDYLDKLVKEGKCDKYLDKPTMRPKRNTYADEKPSAKTIKINDIFAKSEYLRATNNSKKRKI
ncbi:uncharacterized protein [Malus domestica]|uniref:uncharacterized protein n=1 Tax=Malus domestica TaxID=3750 RepID=UPI0039767698